MMIFLLQVAFCVGGMVMLYRLTLPLELQRGRWVRLAISVPPVWMIARTFPLVVQPGEVGVLGDFLAAILCIFFLCFFWREHIAAQGAGKATNFLYGDGYAGGGFVAEFGHARGLMKEGRWEEANAEIVEQLRKEPTNLEARRLLISNHLDLQQPEKALEQAEILLQHADLTKEQRAWATEARKQLGEMVLAKRAAAAKGK